jgi:hypothetical protein
MILQKCAPSLRRRFAAAHHVFADAALIDVDAQLEHITVDSWCTPRRILSSYLADQLSDLTGNDRSSRLAGPHLPGPGNPHADGRATAAGSQLSSQMERCNRLYCQRSATAESTRSARQAGIAAEAQRQSRALHLWF